jgi:hypothetical protein
MTALDEFVSSADKSSPFLKFIDGEPIVGTFNGAELVEDTFNKGEKVMQYSLTVDGVEKTFKSKSVNLARQLKVAKEGDEVKIMRTGVSFNTKWYASIEE